MTYEPLNRRLATLAAVFAFLGVALGVIALATNYWSINNVPNTFTNGTNVINLPANNTVWNVCARMQIFHSLMLALCSLV